MTVQIIARDGEPEYAVLPWAEYQALLRAAGQEHAAGQALAAARNDEAERPPLARLQALREARGLSPGELARSVGISPHYLALIERGERQPDAAILRSLAWTLGLEGWS